MRYRPPNSRFDRPSRRCLPEPERSALKEGLQLNPSTNPLDVELVITDKVFQSLTGDDRVQTPTALKVLLLEMCDYLLDEHLFGGDILNQDGSRSGVEVADAELVRKSYPPELRVVYRVMPRKKVSIVRVENQLVELAQIVLNEYIEQTVERELYRFESDPREGVPPRSSNPRRRR